MERTARETFIKWLPDWVQDLLERPPEISAELLQLQTDWIAENSDAREEGIWRDEYLRRIQTAKERREADKFNPTRLLELAEAYAILEPRDKRILPLCERLTNDGDLFYDKQRQGDTYQLYGRSLFLACRYEEASSVMLKAHACYRENGNRKLRRINNTGLLRVYAALGDSRKCAERLEVALTQCEEKDDSMLLYMHAKNALEKTGTPRDAEILDDIWYVFLDTHPDEKRQWDNFQNMGDNVLRQCKTDDDDDAKTFGEAFSSMWPSLKRDLKQSTFFRVVVTIFLISLCLYVFLLALSSKPRR